VALILAQLHNLWKISTMLNLLSFHTQVFLQKLSDLHGNYSLYVIFELLM